MRPEEMSEVPVTLSSFALDSANVNRDVWTGPKFMGNYIFCEQKHHPKGLVITKPSDLPRHILRDYGEFSRSEPGYL